MPQHIWITKPGTNDGFLTYHSGGSMAGFQAFSVCAVCKKDKDYDTEYRACEGEAKEDKR